MALQLFTCIVFYQDPGLNVMKFRNVNNTEKLLNYCESKHGAVKYINVYDKATREYLGRLDKQESNHRNNNSSRNTGARSSLGF